MQQSKGNNSCSGNLSIDAEQEFVFKMLVIGEVGTGKTSIIRRYVHNVYREFNKPTIGVDFALKALKWNQNTVVRLQLWDIAGQERFGHMTRVYYREAVAAAIVFDVNRPSTFDAVLKWKEDLDSKVSITTSTGDQLPLPVVLLANKCDLLTSADSWSVPVAKKDMDAYCKEHGFLGWFETSAKEEKFFSNTNTAFKALVDQTITNELEPPIRDPDIINNPQKQPVSPIISCAGRCW